MVVVALALAFFFEGVVDSETLQAIIALPDGPIKYAFLSILIFLPVITAFFLFHELGKWLSPSKGMKENDGATGDFLFCRFCGAKILSDSIFCHLCGKPTTSIPTPKA